MEGPSIVASLFLCWLLVTTPQPSLPPAPTATRMLLAGVQSPERLCLVPGFVFFFWPYHAACEILTTGGGCCSIIQTLCNPMVCSTPGFPVLHHLPEFAQKLMSIESVMPSNHLILCCPLLLPPSIFPSIRVFSNESVLHIRWPKYWNFSFSSSPSSGYSGLISFRMDWLDLLAIQGTLKISPNTQFKSINSSALSLLYGPTVIRT